MAEKPKPFTKPTSPLVPVKPSKSPAPKPKPVDPPKKPSK